MKLASLVLAMSIATSAFALDPNYPMAKSKSSIEGQGTYHFGPETSENLACSLAEERAKEVVHFLFYQARNPSSLPNKGW